LLSRESNYLVFFYFFYFIFLKIILNIQNQQTRLFIFKQTLQDFHKNAIFQKKHLVILKSFQFT